MILTSSICNRLAGHKINGIESSDWILKSKRAWLPLLVGLSAFMWAIIFKFSTENAFGIFIIMSLFFAAWAYSRSGEMFMAMHGNYFSWENRKKNPATWLADSLFLIRSYLINLLTKRRYVLFRPDTQNERIIYGILWGGFNSLFWGCGSFIILWQSFNNWHVLLAGLGLLLTGLIYWAVGRFIVKSSPPAEIITGALWGCLNLIGLYLCS